MAYVAAAAALYQGLQKSQADAANAQVMGYEKNAAIDQANVQEGMVRRNSRQALGAQMAAFGASGAGYGGSSGRALDQSAINQEMDALNTRYKGAITGYGYGVQQKFDNSASTSDAANGVLMAGAKVLSANSSLYTLSQPVSDLGGGAG